MATMLNLTVDNVLRYVLVIIMGVVSLCLADDGWVAGRATWFDVGPDISTANCHFPWAPTGRDVGAWPDVMEGFASSCGKCYEIKCRNADFSDGNGEYLQRSNACYDESKSVIITIVDACPCHYPSNSHSNRRWCCGDMNHIDISYEAFQQIADLGIGVIGLYYREVDCSSKASVGNGGGSSSNGNGNAGGNSNGNSGSSGGLNWGGW